LPGVPATPIFRTCRQSAGVGIANAENSPPLAKQEKIDATFVFGFQIRLHFGDLDSPWCDTWLSGFYRDGARHANATQFAKWDVGS
jgi:hypothetical protein